MRASDIKTLLHMPPPMAILDGPHGEPANVTAWHDEAVGTAYQMTDDERWYRKTADKRAAHQETMPYGLWMELAK